MAEPSSRPEVEWELSKENVQPLRRGRDAQALCTSLLEHEKGPRSRAEALDEKRRAFAKAIEEYQGSDPLDLWLKLVKWIQNEFPTAGSKAELVPVLEKCTRLFLRDVRYKEDVRYLRVWILYADNCPDPKDIFSFLQANDIGQGHSLYYEAYATFLEINHVFKSANAVYEQGINRQAVPLERLKQKYEAFQHRMAMRIQRKMQEGGDAKLDEEPEPAPRSTLAHVGGRGRLEQSHAAVGASYPAASAPASQQTKRSKGQQNSRLEVFEDEEFVAGSAASNKLQATTHPWPGAAAGGSVSQSWSSLPTQQERRKENQQEPSAWAGVTLSAATKPSTRHDATPANTLEIFVDEEFQQQEAAKRDASATAPSMRQRLEGGPPVLHSHTHSGRGSASEDLLLDPLKNIKKQAQAEIVAAVSAPATSASAAPQRQASLQPQEALQAPAKHATTDATEPAREPADDNGEAQPGAAAQARPKSIMGFHESLIKSHTLRPEDEMCFEEARAAQWAHRNQAIKSLEAPSKVASTAASLQVPGLSQLPQAPHRGAADGVAALAEATVAAQIQGLSLGSARDVPGERATGAAQSLEHALENLKQVSKPAERAAFTQPPGEENPAPEALPAIVVPDKPLPLVLPPDSPVRATLVDPTINTKMALADIMSMFNQPLSTEPERAGAGASRCVDNDVGSMFSAAFAGTTSSSRVGADAQNGRAGVAVVGTSAPLVSQAGGQGAPLAATVQGPRGLAEPSPAVSLGAPGALEIFVDDDFVTRPLPQMARQDSDGEILLMREESGGDADDKENVSQHQPRSTGGPLGMPRLAPRALGSPEVEAAILQPLSAARAAQLCNVRSQDERAAAGENIEDDVILVEEAEESLALGQGAAASEFQMASTADDAMPERDSFVVWGDVEGAALYPHLAYTDAHRVAAAAPSAVRPQSTPASQEQHGGTLAPGSAGKALASAEEPGDYTRALTSEDWFSTFVPARMTVGEPAKHSGAAAMDENMTDVDAVNPERLATSGVEIGLLCIGQGMLREGRALSPIQSASDSQSEASHHGRASSEPAIESGSDAVAASPAGAKGQHLADLGRLLSSSMRPDPFDESFTAAMMQQLQPSLATYEGFINHGQSEFPGKATLQKAKRDPKLGSVLELAASTKFIIKDCIGKGAYASIHRAFPYRVDEPSGRPAAAGTEQAVALKIQSPPCPWEFYICRQLAIRIPETERPAFLGVHSMHVWGDASVMAMRLQEGGTLQDVINAYLKGGKRMAEELCAFYTIELLRMMEAMHAAGFIHADIKPDNLLIRDDSEDWSDWVADRDTCWRHKGLTLIDWGRSIDLSLLPPGTEFTGDSNTEAFRCTEMADGRPWTFQADTFALCGVVHCMLFGKYMEITKSPASGGDSSQTPVYSLKEPLKRYWQVDLWRSLFDTLLNVRDCVSNPPLAPLRKRFEAYLAATPARSKQVKMLLMKQNVLMFDHASLNSQ
eukprot:jgi/Mesvir1/28487/Mv15902-RA.5